MVAISSMGIKYKDFTSLLEPTTGKLKIELTPLYIREKA